MSTSQITRTVKTRILVISDTHFASPARPDLNDLTHAFRSPLPHADLLIHCGDLTNVGTFEENVLASDFIRRAPAELKLVIPGNHDVTLDETYYSRGRPHMHLSPGIKYPQDTTAIRELYTGPEAHDAGIRYMEEGAQTFALNNGATVTVYASAYTPEFMNWSFAYERDEDRFNGPAPGSESPARNPVPEWPLIDVMVTHGPPLGILDEVVRSRQNAGCGHLRKAVMRCRPRVHAFGHIHEGWGMERWDWKREKGQGGCVKRWDADDAGLDAADPEDKPQTWVKNGGRFVDFSSTNVKDDGLKFGEETVFVNASIMDVKYRPVNAPWIVDLDLPLR